VEEEWFCLLVDEVLCRSRLGVVTSSVLMVAAPRRLIECTSFRSHAVPFRLTFFGLEAKDMAVNGKVRQDVGIKGPSDPHIEDPL